jgi:predicted MPP superfamily phosphohydrolase
MAGCGGAGEPYRNRARRRAAAAGLALFALAAFCITTACVSFRTVSYTLETDRFKPGAALVIILITDLHSTVHGANQEPLIQAVRERKPDLIFLAGDIIDDKAPVQGARLLLAGIKGLAPVYYVSGNHEYWSPDVPAVWAELRSFGVRILSDEYERLTIRGSALIIAGVEDPDKALAAPRYDPDKAMGEAFAGLEAEGPQAYKILLAHRPERIARYKQYPFDLVVSGHTHGGQVRIPFLLNGLYAPNQGLFPRYAGGLYTHTDTRKPPLFHIISRGLSINPRLPRIFNPPELVHIRIIPKILQGKTL